MEPEADEVAGLELELEEELEGELEEEPEGTGLPEEVLEEEVVGVEPDVELAVGGFPPPSGEDVPDTRGGLTELGLSGGADEPVLLVPTGDAAEIGGEDRNSVETPELNEDFVSLLEAEDDEDEEEVANTWAGLVLALKSAEVFGENLGATNAPALALNAAEEFVTGARSLFGFVVVGRALGRFGP